MGSTGFSLISWISSSSRKPVTWRGLTRTLNWCHFPSYSVWEKAQIVHKYLCFFSNTKKKKTLLGDCTWITLKHFIQSCIRKTSINVSNLVSNILPHLWVVLCVRASKTLNATTNSYNQQGIKRLIYFSLHNPFYPEGEKQSSSCFIGSDPQSSFHMLAPHQIKCNNINANVMNTLR